MEQQLIELIKKYISHSLKFQKIRTKRGFEKKYKLMGETYSRTQKELVKTTLVSMVDSTFGLGEEYNPLIKQIITQHV